MVKTRKKYLCHLYKKIYYLCFAICKIIDQLTRSLLYNFMACDCKSMSMHKTTFQRALFGINLYSEAHSEHTNQPYSLKVFNLTT